MELSIGTGNLIHLRQPRLAELQHDEIHHEYQDGPGEESISQPCLMLDGHRGYLYYFDAPRRPADRRTGFRWRQPHTAFGDVLRPAGRGRNLRHQRRLRTHVCTPVSGTPET